LRESIKVVQVSLEKKEDVRNSNFAIPRDARSVDALWIIMEMIEVQ
jgi:hypothetical protein